MKKGIHPEYVDTVVTCTCGNTFHTRSTPASRRFLILAAVSPVSRRVTESACAPPSELAVGAGDTMSSAPTCVNSYP